MPYVRITMSRRRSQAELGAISACLHQAMVSAFNVPARDLFHFFQICDAGEAFVDPTYLTSGRTINFLHFEIVVGRPRDTGTKAALYASLAAALTSSLDIAPGDVMVVIHTTQSEDWSFGDGLTADVSLDRFGPRHSQS